MIIKDNVLSRVYRCIYNLSTALFVLVIRVEGPVKLTRDGMDGFG